MTVMTVPAMAVRMMVSSMPVPAMAPLGKERLTISQHPSDHDDETKHMQRSHESGPSSESSVTLPRRPFSAHLCRGIHLSPDWKRLIVILQAKFSKNRTFLTLLESEARDAAGV